MNHIKNYNEIVVPDNTLVVLDIDETIIKFNGLHNTWVSELRKYYELFHEKKKADQMALNEWINIISTEKPELLDEELFLDLVDRVKKSNSDLILLTARNKELCDVTIKNLKDCNLDIDSNDIYYSWPKGNKLVEVYNNKYVGKNVIFVDDKLDNLEDVEKSLKENNINITSYLITHEKL